VRNSPQSKQQRLHHLVRGHGLDGGDVSVGGHVQRVVVSVDRQHAADKEQEAGDKAKVQDNRELGVLEAHLRRVFRLALEQQRVCFVVGVGRQGGVDDVRVVRLRHENSKRDKSYMKRGLWENMRQAGGGKPGGKCGGSLQGSALC
jgi:hypothetical protein